MGTKTVLRKWEWERILMSLADLLRQKRREHRLRQEDVAAYLGFESKNGYWSIENERTKLKAYHIRRLMQLYSVPAEFFIIDTDNSTGEK